MPRLKAVIEIDAPREHVFAVAGDLTKRPEWTTFVKEVTFSAGDGKSVGTKDRMVAKIGPRPNKWEGELTEYAPGEAWARKFSGYFKGDERITFTPAGNATLVEWRVNYTPPFGIIGQLGAFILMARIYQNELEGSLENLKLALEV
jgi:uncharacterized membrane protein